MKKQPKTRSQGQLESFPKFVRLQNMKSVPRGPVILVVSAREWAAATKGLKRGKLDPKRPAIRFMPAPWGDEDIVLYPVDPSTVRRLRCLRIRRVIDEAGRVTWEFEIDCGPSGTPPSEPGTCREMFVMGHGGRLEAVDCRPDTCRGACTYAFVGGPFNGHFQCKCTELRRG